MIARPLLAFALCAALLAGCGRKAPDGPIAVSVVGPAAALAAPGGVRPARPDVALLNAVAQGLVRFDASGQVGPGLAIRWAISDDGLYYTFRLGSDGPTADQVARQLRRSIRVALDELVAVTPEVIEIRLAAPRPALMALLARAEFAILPAGKGTGPLRLEAASGTLLTLRAPPLAAPDSTPAAPGRLLLLRGERAGLAVARFVAGEAALVTGGTFADIAYPRVAGLAAPTLQADPANGLFGLKIVRTTPLLGAVEVRQALSMALDRDAIGEALGAPGWRSTPTILPAGTGDIAVATRPAWAQALANVGGGARQAADVRAKMARRLVAEWVARHKGAPRPIVRIALPDGPGATILFHALAAQWSRIGVAVERVGAGDPAEFALVDTVAPADQADWYLDQFRCGQGGPCSELADQAVVAARATQDPAERARLLADAERRLAEVVPFVPLAQPLRWSLVAPRLEGFATNPRAVHPLAALIGR